MIQSGVLAVGKAHFESAAPDWNLLAGEGWRTYSRTICFDSSFNVPPKVHVALSALDILQGANTRIFCRATNISETNFELEIGTWCDTHVWGATVSWIAFGEGT